MDPSLVTGRRALLRALSALDAHAGALILIGAQAVQEWAADRDDELGGSPASFDADLQVDAAVLGPDPTLEQALMSAGFTLGSQPGIWIREGTQVDVLVAEAQAKGRGSRSAALDVRDPKSARRARGLEPCLVLNERRTLRALGDDSPESATVRVARPAALIVAKTFKIADRLANDARRARAKDALDVLRLLRLDEPDLSASDFRTLTSHADCGAVAAEGLGHLRRLFATPVSPGARVLRDGYVEQGPTFAAQISALTTDWLARFERT